MKKTLVLISLFLAVVMLAGLCACGNAKTDTDKLIEAQYQKDKETLTEAGYMVSVFNGDSLRSREKAENLENGTLKAYLTALKNGASQIKVYYLASESAAATFQATKEGSVLKGYAVILGDTAELISK